MKKACQVYMVCEYVCRTPHTCCFCICVMEGRERESEKESMRLSTVLTMQSLLSLTQPSFPLFQILFSLSLFLKSFMKEDLVSVDMK